MRALIFIFSLGPVWLYWDLRPDGDIENLEWWLLLVYGCFSYLFFKLWTTYVATKSELKDYQSKDFLRQEGWTKEKQQALKEGVTKGHDLERLAETLGHSEASVRGKLVKLKIYDSYLENFVEQGTRKFSEWQKLQRKIGKVIPLEQPESSEIGNEEEPNTPKSDSAFVNSLTQNWFDPRIEFCESFYLSPVSQLPDPQTHNDVIRHVASFLNSAGGYVLIGVGREGKVLGLFDDDLRTPLHYTHRLSEALRKTLGDAAMKFIEVTMVRVSSEDLCLVTCQKSTELVLCCHQGYNKLMGRAARELLHYDRNNAMTKLLEEQSGAEVSESSETNQGISAAIPPNEKNA